MLLGNRVIDSCRATSRIKAAVQGGGGYEKINARKDSGDGGGDDRGRRVASRDLGGDRKREEKREIATWFRIWLETPDAFFDWLDVRKQSPEFKARFPDLESVE